MLKTIDLTATESGKVLLRAGFQRISARRYLRVTDAAVAQRIELRPNRHGGELTCDLTIHPLWARETLTLQVLEPAIWIGALSARSGMPSISWYERSETGLQQMTDAILLVGMPWFEANSTAHGLIESANSCPEPWQNAQHVHVELGHAYLRAGQPQEALQNFERKPSRVARFKSIAKWIASGDVEQIEKLHADWIASSRASLPGNWAL